MITKTSLARALLLVDKDKRATLPFACPTTPGWLWAGPWAVRSDKMGAARVEGGEVAATSAAILRDASALPGDLRNRLALRDGPRESSDGKVSLYVLAWSASPGGGGRAAVAPAGGVRRCGATARASRSPGPRTARSSRS